MTCDIKIAEFARRSGLPRRTVQAWLDQGELLSMGEKSRRRLSAADAEIAGRLRRRLPLVDARIRRHIWPALRAAHASGAPFQVLTLGLTDPLPKPRVHLSWVSAAAAMCSSGSCFFLPIGGDDEAGRKAA